MRRTFTEFLLRHLVFPWDAWFLLREARRAPSPADIARAPRKVLFRSNGRVWTLLVRSNSSDVATIHEIFFREIYRFAGGFVPKNILDIGANVGYATMDFAMRYPAAQIAAFEPVQENFRQLEAHVLLNNLAAACFPFGLGRTETDVELFSEGTAGMTGSSSMLRPVKPGLSQGKAHIADALTAWDDLGWDPIDLIKIDCEGAEEEIIARIAPRLHRVERMTGELHTKLCDTTATLALLRKTHHVKIGDGAGAGYFHFSAQRRC
jgi:FkbM family methyltransferase